MGYFGLLGRRAVLGLVAALVIAGGAVAQETRSVTHKFGTTEVPVDPQRIVSVGWDEHDLMLTFGKVSVLQRDAWGEQPFGTWPWAIPALNGAEPETFTDDMPFERILAAKPDLIMATWSGIDEDTYKRLSQIAPTVAGDPAYEDWASPWDARIRFIGKVFGTEAEAEAAITGVADRIAAVKAAHPEWAGKTAVSVTVEDANFYVAANEQHSRGKLLLDLGFTIPPEAAVGAENGHAEFGFEQLPVLDQDVLIWVNGSDDPSPIVNIPLRPRLKAHAEGREVYADKVLTAAFSIQSPLSFAYLLDHLVPEIERAIDGDPATVVELSEKNGLTAP